MWPVQDSTTTVVVVVVEVVVVVVVVEVINAHTPRRQTADWPLAEQSVPSTTWDP